MRRLSGLSLLPSLLTHLAVASPRPELARHARELLIALVGVISLCSRDRRMAAIWSCPANFFSLKGNYVGQFVWRDSESPGEFVKEHHQNC